MLQKNEEKEIVIRYSRFRSSSDRPKQILKRNMNPIEARIAIQYQYDSANKPRTVMIVFPSDMPLVPFAGYKTKVI